MLAAQQAARPFHDAGLAGSPIGPQGAKVLERVPRVDVLAVARHRGDGQPRGTTVRDLRHLDPAAAHELERVREARVALDELVGAVARVALELHRPNPADAGAVAEAVADLGDLRVPGGEL